MVDCVIFGGLLLDKYYRLEGLPKRGQDGFITEDFERVGGCAINMAATFNNLGGNAHVVSYVGQDLSGKAIIHYLNKHQFSQRYVKEKEGSTGYCLVFLEPDGERTFLTKTGMELEFSGELIGDAFQGIQYAAVTGYFLLNQGAEKIIEALEQFWQGGGYILFDPSPLVGSIQKDILQRMLCISSIITPNISEMDIIMDCELEKSDSLSVEDWIRQFVSEGKAVVLKKGAEGGMIYEKACVVPYDAVKVDAVDTTGAGDSFAAGVLYGIAKGSTLQDAVGLGKETSGMTVKIHGPHGFWKTNQQMKQILDSL